MGELIPYQAVLPEKYHFLLDAPREDSDGNPAIIRYSRKTKEQYVMTENAEGKASGWSAYFNDGKWDVQETKKAETETNIRALTKEPKKLRIDPRTKKT